MKGQERVVFLAPRAFQPRYYRRIGAWLESGWDVTLYHFQRGDGDRVPEGASPELSAVTLGAASDRGYVRRVPQLLSARRSIREHERGNTPAAYVYCFGWDMTALGIAACPAARYVTEIADIRAARLRSRPWFRSVWGLAERRLARRVDSLVLTSPGFLEAISPGSRMMSRIMIHENALPVTQANEWTGHRAAAGQRNGARMRVGVIGLFRYPFALLPFLDAAGACRDGRISVDLFGTGELTPEVESYSRRFQNIRYHGRFQAPDDLPRIYRDVDIVFAVYDNRNFNVRIALPNKLYEAAFFGVPIVVASDTLLAERVERLGIGWPVDPRRSGWAHDWLRALTPEAVNVRRAAALSLPLDQLVTDEARLVREITSR